MGNQIKTAVITTAGLGTRFLPVTRVVQKMLLPVINHPLIHFSVSEAAAAGIEQVVLVTGPDDKSTTGYFETNPTLEATLTERANLEELERQQALTEMVHIEHVIQDRPLGFGHAVLMAKPIVGDEHFALILPDDLIWSNQPVISQLMEVQRERGGNVIAAKRVKEEEIEALGIIAGNKLDNRTWHISGVVEKPPLSNAPSNLAIIGRYLLGPTVFEHLLNGKPGTGNEIQLTDAIAQTLADEPFYACLFDGDHIDAGTPVGMLAASIYAARRQPAFYERVNQILNGLKH